MLASLFLSLAREYTRYFPPGALRTRVARGAIWSLCGAVLTHGLGVLASIAAARLLGRAVYGELGMIKSTVGMFGTLAGLGLGVTATKHVAQWRESSPLRAGRIIGLSSVAAIIAGGAAAAALLGLAPLLADRTINASHLTGELRLAAALLLLNTINGTQHGALAGLEAFDAIARVSLLQGLAQFPLVVAGAWLLGLFGAVAALSVSAAIGLAANHLALGRECAAAQVPIAYRGINQELPVLWGFSLPSVLSGALVAPVAWACNAMLVRQPDGYAELGILSAANQVRALTLLLSSAAFSCLLPVLSSEMNAEGTERQSPKLHAVNAYATWFLATAGTVLLLYLAAPVLELYGKGFVTGNLALVLVLCSIPIVTYKQGIARLIAAKSMLWYGVASNLVWGAILLIGAHWLVAYGAAGLGAAYLGAYVLNAVVTVPLYLHRLGMGRLLRRDCTVGALLTTAVVPGLLRNLFDVPAAGEIALLALSLAALSLAGRQIWRWVR